MPSDENPQCGPGVGSLAGCDRPDRLQSPPPPNGPGAPDRNKPGLLTPQDLMDAISNSALVTTTRQPAPVQADTGLLSSSAPQALGDIDSCSITSYHKALSQIGWDNLEETQLYASIARDPKVNPKLAACRPRSIREVLVGLATMHGLIGRLSVRRQMPDGSSAELTGAFPRPSQPVTPALPDATNDMIEISKPLWSQPIQRRRRSPIRCPRRAQPPPRRRRSPLRPQRPLHWRHRAPHRERRRA